MLGYQYNFSHSFEKYCETCAVMICKKPDKKRTDTGIQRWPQTWLHGRWRWKLNCWAREKWVFCSEWCLRWVSFNICSNDLCKEACCRNVGTQSCKILQRKNHTENEVNYRNRMKGDGTKVRPGNYQQEILL